MTDFLQGLIDEGLEVKAHKIQHKWLEFDTEEDYEKMLELANAGKIQRFCEIADKT